MCTLYKGVPHGIAVINYIDPYEEYKSFRGAGIFDHGQLHNTPFSYIKDNWGYSLAKMENGRPADATFFAEFLPEGVRREEKDGW
jgi:hypothetical protein